MHGPPLVEWLLVALSAATGAYGLHRARAGAAGERRAACGDALMGLGMAVMALPAVTSAGRPWGAGVFTAVFAAAGLYAVGSYATGTCAAGRRAAGRVGRPYRRAADPHHAVGAFAMAYMALAMAGGHHHRAGTPLLTGLLLVYFAGDVVRSATALVPAPSPGPPPHPLPVRPTVTRRELTRACRISMGMGMLTMLLMM
ncbi:DUF5134 domain-containing protein [Streptomyces luteireticuli]|uniref:DUF5134 domain-containing protein n=1 Tax=Streptomyces luteireticuli TaxID=173858 RepID=UPI003557F4DD